MDKFKDSLKNILGKMVPGKQTRGEVVDKFKGAFATDPQVKILANIEKATNKQFLLIQTIQDSIRRIEDKVLEEDKKSFGKKIFEFLITGLNKLPGLITKGLSSALTKMGLGKIANMLKGPSTPPTLTKPTPTGPGGPSRKVTVTNIKPIPVIEAGLPSRDKKGKRTKKGPQTKVTKPDPKTKALQNLPDQTRSAKQLNVAQNIADANKGPSAAQKLGKGALRAARFLGPAGAVLSAGMAVGDAVQGYGDEATAENLGIQGRDPTTGEKASSAAGSAISGLTFGLVDKGSASKAIAKFFGAGPGDLDDVDEELRQFIKKDDIERFKKEGTFKRYKKRLYRAPSAPNPLLGGMTAHQAYQMAYEKERASPEAVAKRDAEQLKKDKDIASGKVETITEFDPSDGTEYTRKVTAEDVQQAQRRLDERAGQDKGGGDTNVNVNNNVNNQAPPPPPAVKPMPRKEDSALQQQVNKNAAFGF